ncbi:MAG TPA: hypothetical protein VFV76_07445 [Actinomycetes bacterium]|nr:hypothetical protein [Actinomycetes bacterium]
MQTKSTMRRVLGAVMITVAIAPWVGGTAAQAAVTVLLAEKWNNTSSTNESLDRSGCQYTELVVSHAGVGWHFVLPGGSGLTSFSANFQSAGTITVTTTDTANGAIVQGGKGAVIFTPSDDTLVGIAAFSGRAGQGTAATSGNNDMQLSHICNDGLPTVTTSAPATTTTSAPATTTTSAPATVPVAGTTSAVETTAETSVLSTKVGTTTDDSQTPEATVSVRGVKTGGGGDVLADTGFGGLPLGMALAVSLGLLLGGATLLLVPGRVTVERSKHRRRH